MSTHTHNPGMYYRTVNADPEYDNLEMSLFAAWDDVTNQGRRVMVYGYDPKVPAAGRLLIPGKTKFVKPGLERITKAGKQLTRKRAALTEALNEARQAGIEALGFGMTEVDVANTLGVDRMTVRKWHGKR